jgi:uncharacterized protein YggU (UPF0235/DUF167 family)
MHADLPVRVNPRSSRNKLTLEPDGSLRVWVTASPTDGQANDAVCQLVAAALDIAKSRVSVLRGQTARQKLLRVDGMDITVCTELLRNSLRQI